MLYKTCTDFHGVPRNIAIVTISFVGLLDSSVHRASLVPKWSAIELASKMMKNEQYLIYPRCNVQAEANHVQVSDRTERYDKIVTMLKAVAHVDGNVACGDVLADFQQWDSLAILDFVMDAEKQFGVELSPDEVHKCKTVEDIIHLVELKG
jgi:acyl carrier protein